MKIVATDILNITIKNFEFMVLKLEDTIDFPQFHGVREIWLFYDDFMELLPFALQGPKDLSIFDIPNSYFAMYIPAIWEIGKKRKIFFKGKVFITLNLTGKLNKIL